MTIIMTREKDNLYLYKEVNGQKSKDHVRYNMTDNKIYRPKFNKRTGCLINYYPVMHAYHFFSGETIHTIQCEEEKFIELLKSAKIAYNRGKYWHSWGNTGSISTFLIYLSKVMAHEEYIQQKIPYEFDCRCRLSNYPKNTKKIIEKVMLYESEKKKKEDINRIRARSYDESYKAEEIKKIEETKYYTSHIEYTNTLESYYFRDKDVCDKLFNVLYSKEFDEESLFKFLKSLLHNSRFFNSIITLIKDYNYDIHALMNYCIEYLEPFENIRLEEGVTLLSDYIRMCKTIGRDMKKYPKYLKSMHDIITANYNSYKKEYDEILFAKLNSKVEEWEKKNYIIKAPKSSKEIIQEGTELSHCVGSYVDKILNGKCLICFLREKDKPNESLVTIEIREGKLTQAKGAYNRTVTQEEKTVLEKYCKETKIKYEV